MVRVHISVIHRLSHVGRREHGNGCIHMCLSYGILSKKTICNLTGKQCDIKRTNDMDRYLKNVELWFKGQTM